MKLPIKIIIISLFYIGMNVSILCAEEIGKETGQNTGQNYTIIYPFSQKGNFEIGGVAGMPSGINGRWWIVNFFGIDFTFGSTIRRDVVFTLDFLFEHVTLYRSADMHLRFFYGVGGLIGYDYQDRKMYSNVRLPLGLSMPFIKYPLTLSLFVAPALQLTPKRTFDANFGIAVRYNFGGVTKMLAKQRSLEVQLYESHEESGDLKNKLNETKNELNKTTGELDATKQKLNATRGELDKTSGNLAKAKNELHASRTELSDIKNSLDTTVNELTDTKGKLMGAREKLSGMKKELESTKTELTATRDQLAAAKKKLDDRETELLNKQKELDDAKATIKEKLQGEARRAEEKIVAKKQVELNKEFEEFKKQKETWEKEHEIQKKKREKLKVECAARRGIINEYGYCDCREHEQWNSDRSACVCVRGYYLNRSTDRCEPCELVNTYGACTDACRADEKKVHYWKGPNKYICVKKCSKSNEVWSDRKNTCLCKDGFYRDEKGECVPRK